MTFERVLLEAKHRKKGIPEPGLATRGRGLWKQATSSDIQLCLNI